MSELEVLRDTVAALEHRLRADEAAAEALLGAIHPDYRVSARNFLHYVAVRQVDLRPLQLGLLRQGLSSLGRLEGHVLHAVAKVRERLDDAISRGDAAPPTAEAESGPSWDDAERLLHLHTRALLGPRPADRHVYAMVTAPSAAEADAAWVERLLAAGMNLLRINTAHEDEAAWLRLVTTARKVASARGSALRIIVDLPGPKLRTVMLQEGPRVAKWKPERDDFGRVVTPCQVLLRPRSLGAPAAGKWLAVPDSLWSRLAVGDQLAFRDARGKRRELTVTQRELTGRVIGELRATAYVVPAIRMTLQRDGKTLGDFQLESLPARPMRLELAEGDQLCVVARGARAPLGMKAVGCTLEAALTSLAVGHRVLFDDGHLEAVVEAVAPGRAVLRVTYAAGGTFRLGGEKGINLPDTTLDLPLFAADDELALAFAVQHADLVDASFVRGPQDVRELYRRLAALGADHLGVILKIETSGAFARLPEIILAALERAPVGVMIARGDLAIESGYERLAELQEEILWLCEAAHMPVVWATQVLDTYARTGRPSRAEVTDAAMSVRAECVMLNKGPYVAQALSALDDILRRMEQHQYKKRSLYRKLHLQLPQPAPLEQVAAAATENVAAL